MLDINPRYRFFICLCVALIGFIKPPLQAQDFTGKPIGTESFENWGTLLEPKISDDGNWIAFSVTYPKKSDTLIVTNPNKKITYNLAGAFAPAFIPLNSPQWVVFKNENKTGGILNLFNGSINSIQKMDYYKISQSENIIVAIAANESNTQDLTLVTPNFLDQTTIHNVTDFAMDPIGSRIAYAINNDSSSTIYIRDGNKIQHTFLKKGIHDFHKLVWKPQGDAIAFMDYITPDQTDNKDVKIISWNFNRNKIDSVSSQLPIFNENVILSNLLQYSHDGNKIFFNISPREICKDTNSVNVQEWKGNDPWVYPRRKVNWKWENQWWKMAWWPKSNKLLQIGTEEAPKAIIAPNDSFAILYSPVNKYPQYFEVIKNDFHIINLDSGEKSLVASDLKISGNHINISPKGNYISYFKEKQWWTYKVKEKTTYCLTCAINTSFHGQDRNGTDLEPFGNPKYTKNDKEILLYDKNDIWAISPTTGSIRRLTNGREDGTTYRIDNANTGKPQFTSNMFYGHEYDLKNHPLILKGINNDIPNAYYTMDKKFQLKLIVKSEDKISFLRKANFASTYVYATESSNKPRALYYFKDKSTPVKIYQSNSHQLSSWGKTELFVFNDNNNIERKAILRYPNNYNTDKMYPMIVLIYEERSQYLKNFVIPTYYNDDGFNSQLYTSDEYFVLEPDISYVAAATGFSAVSCVTSAVNSILAKINIDPSRIGLIGHSFGGYETTFIISQSNIFKTAVAGAPVTDLMGFYFSISKDFQIPEFWRFEDQQWRMKIPFFSNQMTYFANSPIIHADKIKTPLLLWAGEEDGVIPSTQSIKIYLALRRLNKEVSFLLYPNEDHALLEGPNQKDLTIRIKKWFDSYLKK